MSFFSPCPTKILLTATLVLGPAMAENPPGQSNVLTAEERRERLTAHDQAFLALNEKIRDPFVMRAPDGWYYLTGTTAGSHWGETIGIHLWRSRDLVEWEPMGFVWDLYRDGKAANSWHFDQPLRNPDFKNPRAVWAPEIHYLNGTFWIPHCLNISGHGLLRSTSGKAEGPYEVMPMISPRLIDAHLYQEEGETWYLWQADYIAKMDDEMRQLVEEPRRITHDGNHPLGYEGVLIQKVEDKYLHIASGRYGYEPTNTYDLYYAVSDQLDTGYGERRMAIKNAGHGNLIQDPNGRWWATAFDHEYIDPENPLVWNFWLVPFDLVITDDDVLFDVKDERFRPTEADQAFVRQLAIDGVPEKWVGKQPWWRPGAE